MERKVTIGYIVKPRGVKGEVFVHNNSRWYEPFESVDEVKAELRGKEFILKIEWARFYGDKFAVKFEGIDSPEEAEDYRNAELMIGESSLPALGESQYYAFEVEGFDVIDHKGRVAGKVVDVINNPANDVFAVEDENEREFLIPAVQAIIDRIDLESKKIHLKEYEGLFE